MSGRPANKKQRTKSPAKKRRKSNQPKQTIYIHAGEDVQPIQPHAIMFFRNNEQIRIHESDEHLYIQYNDNPWKTYPFAPRTSTDLLNQQKSILLLYGDMPPHSEKIYKSHAANKFTNNQVYIRGNLLFLPTQLYSYREFGPTNSEGVVEMTPLEERESIERSFMCKAAYELVPRTIETWFFMRCGKMRFTPGDIRPIE